MPKATHLLIPAWTTGGWGGGAITHRATLWCSERTYVDEDSKFATTTDPKLVTCKRCIAAGGCGPGWKGTP